MSLVDEGEVRGRIAELVKNAGGPSAAARIVGMSREQVSKWAAGDARPPLFAIAMLCDAADTSLDWIVFGPPFQPSLAAKSGVPARGGDVVRVPLYNVLASAGPGARTEAVKILERLPFSKALLDQIGVRESDVHFIRARGDSMEPTIEDGAIVLIDTSNGRISVDGIYAIAMGDDVRIKRIGRGFDGKIVLISDNERYESETLAAPDAEALRVAGKVVWAGGRV
jgi:phage repressor protein C with HTH and peptisase S24 domain